LIKREKQSQASKSFNATSRLFLQTCNRYNVEFECYLNCKYRHACLICEIENHLALQCSIEREQSLSREASWDREESSKRDRNTNAISRKRSWFAIFDSLRWIFEFFFYTLIDEMFLRDLDSLKRNDWLDMFRDHFNLTYTRVILDIIQCDAKIEYIDSSQLILSENLIFVNEAFDIITNNVNSQIEKSRIAQVNNVLEFFISFSLELVSKSNDDWRKIHHLSHFKKSSINDHISRK
jgi:hypothetical protein